MKTLLVVCAVAVGLLFVSRPAFAVPVEVPIVDPGFEGPPTFTGGLNSSSSAAIPTWNIGSGGGSGRYRLATTGTDQLAAYMNNGNFFSQVLTGSVLNPYSTYELTFEAGRAPNGTAYGGYNVWIEAMNDSGVWDIVATANGTIAGGASLGNGQFMPVNLTFETLGTLVGSDGSDLIGNQIRIRGTNGGGVQTLFDDFFLTVESNAAVPEPAGLAIWGLLGGVGLAYSRRRKAKRNSRPSQSSN